MSKMSGFDIPLRFFRLLVLRKKTILLITLLPTLLCAIVVMVSRSTYEADALIKPPSGEGTSSIESALKESAGMGGGLLGSVLGGSESGTDDCMNLLKSVRFAKLVIDRFDLATEYKLTSAEKPKKYYFADLVKRFQRNTQFQLTEEEDAIEISMRDKSPEQAREMVSFMIYTLDSLYTDLQRTTTQRQLEYVDQRLSLADSDMKHMEDSLVAFQGRYNLVAPEAQVKLILENATQTEIQVETLKEQMALEAALRGTSSASYKDLATQKDLLERAVQRQLRSPSDSNTLILPTRTLPALAIEYFRRERAYDIKLEIYKYLVQQAEALKMEANKNVQVISVLDPPWTNDKRVSPQRRVLVETVFILSFIFAVLIVLLQTAWEMRKKEDSESENIFLEIKRNLFKF